MRIRFEVLHIYTDLKNSFSGIINFEDADICANFIKKFILEIKKLCIIMQ